MANAPLVQSSCTVCAGDGRSETDEKIHRHRVTAYLFVRPRVREPPDDSGLELLGNAPERHVLFDAVHAVLELHPGHVHVADHAADVADDRGEYEHAGQEVGHHEHVFQFVFRLRRLACGPTRQSTRRHTAIRFTTGLLVHPLPTPRGSSLFQYRFFPLRLQPHTTFPVFDRGYRLSLEL